MSFGNINQNILDKLFGSSVRICGRYVSIFGDGQCVWISVDCGTAAEHNIAHMVGLHDFKKIQRADKIVGIVHEWQGNALTHCFQSSKMNHTAEVEAGKQVVKRLSVQQINLEECNILPSHFFQPVNAF